MEIGDYRGNSHKSRETPVPVKIKTVKKIASGKVAPKNGLQKVTEEFIAENIENVKAYIWHDIIVPAAKSLALDIIRDGSEMMLEGRVRGNGSRKSSYISYDSKSDRRSSYTGYNSVSRSDTSDKASSRSSLYHFDNIVVATRGEAEDILFTMEEIISEYEIVTVADLYELAGINGSHTDNKYGWRSISSASIMRIRDGYLLKFPKPVVID